MTITKQQLRDHIADNLKHDNKEFIRQVREGERDESPWMAGAFLALECILENYTLASVSGEVRDE